MPDGTYLTSITQNGQRYKIQGIAQSATRVSSLMRNIDASSWLKHSELESIEDKKGNTLGSEFTLYADQVASSDDADGAAGSPGKPKPKQQTARRPQ